MIFLAVSSPLNTTDYILLLAAVFGIILLCSKLLNVFIPVERRIPLITSVFWAGFILRIAIIIGSEILKYHPDFAELYGHLAGDESVYSRWANNLMRRYLRGEDSVAVKGMSHSGFYLVLNALVFYVFGYKPIFMKLVNCIAGMLLSLVVYRTSSLLFDRNVSSKAMMITHLFPSLLLWSSLGVREIWVSLFIMLCLYYTVKSKTMYSSMDIILLVISLLILSQLRAGTFLVLLISLLPSLFISRSTKFANGIFVFSSVSLVFMFFILYVGVGQEFISVDPMGQMQEIKIDLTGGDAAYFSREELKKTDNPLYIMPRGLIYFMFSPFPWELTKGSRVASFADVVIIYFLTIPFLLSMYKIVKHRYWEALPLVIVFLLLVFAFSMVEGNFGTAFRHRAQILPIYVLISSITIPFMKNDPHT